jgi:putative DNA primase/helicase
MDRSGNKTIAPLTPVEVSTYYRSRIPALTQEGSEWRGPCPLHGGERESFAVNAESGAWFCHSECGGGSVVEFEAKLNHNGDTKAAWKAVCEAIGRKDYRPIEVHKREVAAYDYQDADGKLVFQVVRMEPKDFRQRQPNPAYSEGGTEKQWIYTTKGLPKLLYRLPQVIKAETVYVVEGEKDVHTLEALGLTATCNVGGASKSPTKSKWLPAFNKFFKGKHVVILPDQDEPGKLHGGAVARGVVPVAASVKMIDLPGGKDVSDWVAAGGTATELAGLVQDAKVYESTEMVPASAGGWEIFLSLLKRPSDLANGEIFAKLHSDVARYVPGWGKWIVWREDEGRWAVDDSLLIHQLAVGHLRNMRQAALDLRNNELMAHTVWTESRGHTDNMLASARSFLVIHPDQLDTDLYVLNVKNGTLDLKTGELREHRKSDFITKLVPVNYDPHAFSEEFEEFLSQIMLGDEEMVEFLQTFVGYSLCGWIGERKLAALHGQTGANGKSTFRDILKIIAGEYYTTADFATFQQATIKRDGSQATPDLARLQGARIVTASEPKKGTVLDAGLIKNATGGDPITARRLHQEPFEFMPQFALWLIFNDAPRLVGDDDAAWGRVLRVAFDYKFKEMNLARKDRLTNAEITGPAALAWAVRGSVRYHRDGLKIPKKVTEGTQEYREEQDPLLEFYEDHAVFRAGAHWETSDLHYAYAQWCASERWPEWKIMSRRKLVAHLKKFRKCEPFEVRKDVWALGGIGPRTRDKEPGDLVPARPEDQQLGF